MGGVWGHTEPDSERNVAGVLEGKLSAHQLASSAGERQGLFVRWCVCVCVYAYMYSTELCTSVCMCVHAVVMVQAFAPFRSACVHYL